EVNQEAISQKEILFNIEKEQEKVQFERQRSLYLRSGLVLLAVLLAILIFLLLINIKRKRFIARQKDLISNQNKDLNNSLHRQSLLLTEIHHRVKNNLQLIISLLDLQGRRGEGTLRQHHLQELADKVYSIALIHEQLYRSGELEKIELKSYFEEIVTHFRARRTSGDFQIELDIMPLKLNLETAFPLGVICTELISNSLKYARTDQQLKLSLSLLPEAADYQFCYQDNGPGYDAGCLQQRDGLGAMLIHSMVRQLQADSTTDNNKGARFCMVFREKQVARV
ncbi:MAG: sensor histidine kinase, partial [Phaeodactylibacter sp.]|nr:sensor histidine kinase [Phaeodactylibacter sp.]